MKKIIAIIFLIVLTLTTTSCFKRDDLEDINVYTTIYPIEYLTDMLYGYNSTVLSIYPNGVDPTSYQISDKKIKDYANNSALFIYNGLSDEKKIAASFLNNNSEMKIIDVSQGLSYNYYLDELWLNPTNYLMMASNIRKGLKTYISNQYIVEEIDKNYETLKEKISVLESEIALIVENSNNKTIIVGNDTFLFLEKYGYDVISLDETNNDLSNSTINKAKSLINGKTVSYIFMLDGESTSDTINNIIKNTTVKLAYIKTFSNLTTEQRNNNETYLTIMGENIELIRKEMYD